MAEVERSGDVVLEFAQQSWAAGQLRRHAGLNWDVSLCQQPEQVPLADASFDLAISEYRTSIWCDPSRWVLEATRLLPPGGRLVPDQRGSC